MAGDTYFAVIDGTGVWNDVDYRSGMAMSFCTQIATAKGLAVNGPICNGFYAQYQRGPSTDGYTTKDKGLNAYRFLLAKKKLDPAGRIMLAGYSRGGSAAIIAAEEFDRSGVAVDAMFLFDPVARTATTSAGEIIPKNVAYVAVASRLIDDAMVRKYDGKFTKVGKAVAGSGLLKTLLPTAHRLVDVSSKLVSDWSHPLRPGFGKVGVEYMGTGWYRAKTFPGSHGALGGVGWKNVDEDAGCQGDVAEWMSDRFAEVAVHFTLRSTSPTQIWT